MTEERLKAIERTLDAEDHPGDVWFIETVEELVAEVRRSRAAVVAAQEMYKAVVDHYGEGLPTHLRDFLRERLAEARGADGG